MPEGLGANQVKPSFIDEQRSEGANSRSGSFGNQELENYYVGGGDYLNNDSPHQNEFSFRNFSTIHNLNKIQADKITQIIDLMLASGRDEFYVVEGLQPTLKQQGQQTEKVKAMDSAAQTAIVTTQDLSIQTEKPRVAHFYQQTQIVKSRDSDQQTDSKIFLHKQLQIAPTLSNQGA